MEILVRGKDAAENKKQFESCLETIKKAGKKVAVLKKDNSTGAFADEWKAAFQAADIKEEDQVDLGPILSNAALSVKDEKELVRPFAFVVCDQYTDFAPAHYPRCLPSLERPHDRLLCRRDVRHP